MSYTPNHLTAEINNLDPIAKIAAYKSIAHSCMARAFNAIQRQMREEENPKTESAKSADKDVPLENSEQTIDKANELDNKKFEEPSEQDREPKLGMDAQEQLDLYASLYHGIYEDMKTPETHSKWDIPMEPDVMMDFMLTGDSSIDPVMLKLLAEAVDIKENDMKLLMDADNKKRRRTLEEDRDQILSRFASYAMEDGTMAPWHSLTHVDEHQLGIKAVIGIDKAKDRRTMQILRSKRLNNISDLSVLQEATQTLGRWCQDMENRYTTEMAEIMNSGRDLSMISEVITLKKAVRAEEEAQITQLGAA